MARSEAAMWREYDQVAKRCARQGIKGAVGDPLPDFIGADVHELINADPEAFARRVREFAYALVMERD